MSPAAEPALPRAEQRRQRILDAVIRTVGEGGIDAVTHRRVAAAAGVPLGSTTYYFSGREELIRAAFEHYMRGFQRMLGALYGRRRPGTPAELATFVVELLRREFEAPAMVRVEYELILAATRDPGLAAVLHAWERTWLAGLAEWLEALGVARPVDAARTVLHLIRGFELERLTRPDADPEDLGRRIALLVNALREPSPND